MNAFEGHTFAHDEASSDLPPHVLAEFAASMAYGANQGDADDMGGVGDSGGIPISQHFPGGAAHHGSFYSPQALHGGGPSSYPYYNPLNAFSPSGKHYFVTEPQPATWCLLTVC